MSRELLEIAECSLPMPTSIGSSERVWKVFAWIQCKKRNRLEQERASQLAHVHWSLRYHSRQADPCYEEVILPDVTENPMYSTDDVCKGLTATLVMIRIVRRLRMSKSSTSTKTRTRTKTRTSMPG